MGRAFVFIFRNMETTLKLVGEVTLKNATENENMDDLVKRAMKQLQCQAHLQMTMTLDSGETLVRTLKSINMQLIDQAFSHTVIDTAECVAYERDLKKYAELCETKRVIEVRMKEQYPTRAIAPASRDHSPVRVVDVPPKKPQSSVKNSNLHSKLTDHTARLNEAIVLAKHQEWASLWPAFKTFALENKSKWETNLVVYNDVWKTNAFFKRVHELLLHCWQGKPAYFQRYRGSLEDEIERQYKTDTRHNINRAVMGRVGICAGCDTSQPCYWFYHPDTKNKKDVSQLCESCGTELRFVFNFLGSIKSMVKNKRHYKCTLQKALKWWIELVDQLEMMQKSQKR
jgi:hypothetical protein